MIVHGVLSTFGIYDCLIHEMNEIIGNDIKRENKKVNWTPTQVFDNSNKGKYDLMYMARFNLNYRERFR